MRFHDSFVLFVFKCPISRGYRLDKIKVSVSLLIKTDSSDFETARNRCNNLINITQGGTAHAFELIKGLLYATVVPLIHV